jgi:hypothetical protein
MHCRAVRRGRARQRLAPTTWANPFPSGIRVRRLGRSRPSGRGQALPDPSGPAGPATHANGCRGAVMTTAGAVGSERPGLKPRAQSASPLKGAVRRPGARVDRLAAGAVWISRLQPAWGLSPAVHGRAIVDTAALLICAACRARRVGHDALPRRAARAGEAAPRPYNVDNPSPVGHWCATAGCNPRHVGVRRCLTRPARQGRRPVADAGQSGQAARCGARSERADRRALTPAAGRR